jgi:hypothetical protein
MFSPDEDAHLRSLVEHIGRDQWDQVQAQMPGRSRRQCRERYENYLSPTLSTDAWSPEEDALLTERVRQFGPKWTKIAAAFPRRSGVSLKNHWALLSRGGQRMLAPPPMIPKSMPPLPILWRSPAAIPPLLRMPFPRVPIAHAPIEEPAETEKRLNVPEILDAMLPFADTVQKVTVDLWAMFLNHRDERG